MNLLTDLAAQWPEHHAMLTGQLVDQIAEPFSFGDAAQMVQPRVGETPAHVMHRGHRSLGKARHFGGPTKHVDQLGSERRHGHTNAKMADIAQVKKCRNGICHYGIDRALATHMEIDAIRRAMKERGYNQADLAELLGIDPTAVSKRLTGKRPFRLDEMPKVEAWLGGSSTTKELAGSPVRFVPIIGQVAAGTWREAIESPAGHMPVPADVPRNAIALRVEGDSMDLEIEDGGVVLVDTDDKALFPGRLFVVLNAEGEATFKQFEAEPARLEPRSTNPKHTTIAIGDGQPFTVLGRVTALYRTR